MSASIINPTELRSEVRYELDQFQQKVRETDDPTALRHLLHSLVLERTLLYAELEEMKENLFPYIPRIQFSDLAFSLVLDSLDTQTYNELLSLSKILRMSPGHLLTQLMTQFIKKQASVEEPMLKAYDLIQMVRKSSPATLTVKSLEILTVTEEDLTGVKGRVDFRSIDTLEFLDVSPQTFMQKVHSIRSCSLVRVPAVLPRIFLYAKIDNCDLVEFTEER